MLQKMKACSGENSKDVARQPFVKEIRHVSCGSNQPFQQKQHQPGLKGTEPGQNERMLSDHWDSTSRKWVDGAIQP